MENQKLCEARRSRHSPSDPIPEILSRLPVKSLLRFRCVSKSWLSLVDDADFARLHLNNFKSNSDETHLFVVQCSSNDCSVRRSDTFESVSGNIHSLKEWNIVCTVDGLTLLRHSESSADLKVWNPSIRKFHQLPSLSGIKPHLSLFLAYQSIGLGYDPLAKVYKIIALASVSRDPGFVAIYTLGEQSWKVIEVQVKGSFCSNWCWGSRHCLHSLYCQGGLYFVCCSKNLLYFDLSTEVFSSVTMPKINLLNSTVDLGLVDGGCSLAIFDAFRGKKYSIWVLETESMSWIKRYSFQLKYNREFLYLKKNGDVLICGGRTKKLDQVISYSPETDDYKIIHKLRSSYYEIRDTCVYVESLILHK